MSSEARGASSGEKHLVMRDWTRVESMDDSITGRHTGDIISLSDTNEDFVLTPVV